MLQTSYGAAEPVVHDQPAMSTLQSARVLLPYHAGMAPKPSRSTQASTTAPVTLEDAIAARTDDARWAILSSRSCPRSALPPFIYAVTTTHIYCRPTCPARLARRANIVFFDTASDAARAGYRPCRRCKPDVVPQADSVSGEAIIAGDGEEGRRKVVRAVEIIREKTAEGQRIGLRELAEEVGLSRWHLLRIFRKRWGVTPKEMADGAVTENHRRKIKTGSRIPETAAAESIESGTPPSHGMPRTPDDGSELLEGSTGNAFDTAFADLDFETLAMDLTVPELWDSSQLAEDLLRDLFPEVYQQDAKDLS